MNENNNDIEFYVLQLAHSIEPTQVQKWIGELSTVVASLGGQSLIPGKIGRSEPYLRRAGGQLVDEPLDDDKRSGANKRIMQLASQYDVRGVIAHDQEILDLAISVKELQQTPLILVVQEIYQNSSFLARRKLLKQMQMVDQVICVSNYVANFVQNELKVPEHRISIIYEGFDLHQISSQQVSQERTMSLAHSWGAVENVSELVLVPAVYNDPVWVENLVAFAKEIAENSTADIRYVVVGDDDGSRVMQRLSTQLFRIAPSQIQLAGHCADIEAAIKLTSTVLYFYSKTNSQFSDALIAQALGRFVFLPKDCPASEEFVHESKTGMLLPADPAVVAQTIEIFIQEQGNVREGNFVSSRSFIMQYFSREQMHKNIRALFERPLD